MRFNIPIIQFYENQGPKYSLDVILNEWDNDKWEDNHDFIQWVFPTSTPSQFNPGAPLLDAVQARILETQYEDTIYDAVQRFSDFLVETNAFDSFNHNFLRITRVLQSLKEIGLDALAESFYNFVLTKGSHNTQAVFFWNNAYNMHKL